MVHGTPMLPFDVVILPGESPVKQVVYAASKAILARVLRAGDPFPSVRELSEALKLHPNTVQKVVAELVRDGFLAVRTGVGTVVTAGPRSPDPERRQLLSAHQIRSHRCQAGRRRLELLAAARSRDRQNECTSQATARTHDPSEPRNSVHTLRSSKGDDTRGGHR